MFGFHMPDSQYPGLNNAVPNLKHLKSLNALVNVMRNCVKRSVKFESL